MGKIDFIVGDGGFERSIPSNDSGAGFVMGGGAIKPSDLNFGVVSGPLTNIGHAEDLGITELYDTTHGVLVWETLNRFWFRSPNAEVWIMLVPQDISLVEMATNSQPFLSKLILDSEGKAKTIGLVLNPSANEGEIEEGVLKDSMDAISRAQETIAAHASQYRNIIVLIEARSLTGTAAAMGDFRAEEAGGVGLVAISDPAVWAKNELHKKSGDMGTAVGCFSAAKVNENIGWTEKFNLQDKANGYYLTVGLSDGKLANTREAEFETLTTKGLIFGRTYPQQAGVYFEDAPSCQTLDSDYAYLPETRVVNKAVELSYNALFPRINAPIKVDKDTGKLDIEVCKAFEAVVQRQLNRMEENGEISGGQAYVDADQDIKSQGKLIVVIKIVAVDTGRVIEVRIGFTKKLG